MVTANDEYIGSNSKQSGSGSVITGDVVTPSSLSLQTHAIAMRHASLMPTPPWGFQLLSAAYGQLLNPVGEDHAAIVHYQLLKIQLPVANVPFHPLM